MGSKTQISNNDKELSLLKADAMCLLCSSRFDSTHRCYLTKLIRDKEIPMPLKFCPIHCGRASEPCKNGGCGIFKTQQGKLIDLRCQHKDVHFLLCDKNPCYKISDKYYKNKYYKTKTET